MDKCPKCGSANPSRIINVWTGGCAGEYETVCLETQLAAANERAGRLEGALKDAIDHVSGSRIGHFGGHTAYCGITVRPARLTAWIKALEVPDA